MGEGLRAEFKAGDCTLRVLEDWSLQFTNGIHSYGPIRDVDLLPQVPAIAEALGVKPKEVLGLLVEYRGWARPRLKPLSFEEEELRVTFNPDEGFRIPASQLYHNYRDSLLVGELTYAHAQVVVASSNPGGNPKISETVEPLLIWTYSKIGVNPERLAKPLRMIRRIEVEGHPIHLELKAQYTGTLDTLMSLKAVERFLEGAEPPTWTEAFNQVKGSLERFVSFPWDPRLYDVVSCWILGTYFAELFSAYPFLYIYGSQGSGKSRLMLTAVYLSRHGFVATDPSDASLYRTAEAFRPTLGIDESLLGREAWRLIRTAFKRGLRVPRVEKTKREEFTLALYETYMPVAFASTERPTELGGGEADEARSLFIFMQQAQDPAGRDPEPQDFSELRDSLYQLRLLKAHEVLDALGRVRGSGLPLQGHEWEVWLPILTIARLTGEEVYKNVWGYAEELLAIKSLFQYQEERLLIAAMQRLLESSPRLPGSEPAAEFKPSNLLDHIMAELEERGEYQEARFQRYWTPERVGRILTRMSIFKRKLAKGNYYTITEAKLGELKARYEPNPIRVSAGSGSSGGSGGILEEAHITLLPALASLYDMESDAQLKSPLKGAESIKEPLKSPQLKEGETGEVLPGVPDIENVLGAPSSENTSTTSTTSTKPLEEPSPLTPIEELILRIVEGEGSIGILLLKQRAEARLGRRLEAEEYQGILKNLAHRGLIHLSGEAVSIPKGQPHGSGQAPQPSLTLALRELNLLPQDEEFTPEELSSRFRWPLGFVERVLRLAERDGIMYRTPSDRWRRG